MPISQSSSMEASQGDGIRKAMSTNSFPELVDVNLAAQVLKQQAGGQFHTARIVPLGPDECPTERVVMTGQGDNRYQTDALPRVLLLCPQGNLTFHDENQCLGVGGPDFGGQLVYLKELAAAFRKVGFPGVDLVTRQFGGKMMNGNDWPAEFNQRIEHAEGDDALRIVRLPCGGTDKFVPKEQLWPMLHDWAQQIDHFYRRECQQAGEALNQARLEGDAAKIQDAGHDPALFKPAVTAHYADGGLSAHCLKKEADYPFVSFTAHSLGAQKLNNLLKQGADISRYNFSYRLLAEVIAGQDAEFIVTNSKSESEGQWCDARYPALDPSKFAVIPPGIAPVFWESTPSIPAAENNEETDALAESRSARLADSNIIQLDSLKRGATSVSDGNLLLRSEESKEASLSDVSPIRVKSDGALSKKFEELACGSKREPTAVAVEQDKSSAVAAFSVAKANQIPADRHHLPTITLCGRLDRKKGYLQVLKAYQQSPELQKSANLALLFASSDKIFAEPEAHLEGDALVYAKEMKAVLDDPVFSGKTILPDLKSVRQGHLAGIYHHLAKDQSGIYCHSAFQEPFGLMITEAMAAGMLIASTQDGGPSSILDGGEYGPLMDVNNLQSIEDGLVSILHKSADDLKAMQSKSQQRAKEYSWTSTAESYTRLIVEALARQSNRSASAEQVEPLAEIAHLNVVESSLAKASDDISLESNVAPNRRNVLLDKPA